MITPSASFSILEHLEKLKLDGGSHGTKDSSYHCPVCDSPNFKVDHKTGKYNTFTCDCAASEEGKRRIRQVLSPSQNPNEPIQRWIKPARPKAELTFEYSKADGSPLARVTRRDDGKGKRNFSQQHWNGAEWVNGFPDELRSHCHLYKIFAPINQTAIAKGDPLLILEGEGNVNALHALGIAATTAIGGSGKWRKYGHINYAQDLAGAHLVIVPDRDQPGSKHADEIAEEFPNAQWLYPEPESPEWAELPVSGGFDIADWIILGATADEILGAICARRTAASEKANETAAADEKSVKRTVADQLIDLVLKHPQAELWHTPGREAFLDVAEDGIRQTIALRKAAFSQWLAWRYYLVTQKSAGSEAVQQAISTLEAIAVYSKPEREIHLRIAEHDGKIYIDLADDTWRCVEISVEGWQLVSSAPVRFRRVAGTLPLPLPEAGGSIDDLRDFLNLGGVDWAIVSAWLLNCLKPSKTYPVLILHGETGSGKSTFTTLLKRLVDPGRGELLPGVGDLRNLSITANNRHLIAFDNLSGLSAEQSDALCRIATGGGFTHRTLRTDTDETILEFVRPQIINGIDSIATRGDLLSRAVLVQVPPPKIRLAAADLWANFDKQHPHFFGALLDALSSALRQLSSTNPADLPRMADFARFAIAAEPGLGLEPGEFIAAYDQSRSAAHDTALEASPVGQAIISLMDVWDEWSGTTQGLLETLRQRVDDSVLKSKFFPIDATRLGKLLTRLAPDLRGIGIQCDRRKANGIKLIVLKRTVSSSSTESPSTESPIALTPLPAINTISSLDTKEEILIVGGRGDADSDDDWGLTIHHQEKSNRTWKPEPGQQVGLAQQPSRLGMLVSCTERRGRVLWADTEIESLVTISDLRPWEQTA